MRPPDAHCTGRLVSPSDGRSSTVFSCHPAQGAFDDFGPCAPRGAGARAPPKRLPKGVGADRGSQRRGVVRRTAEAALLTLPRSPLPDTLVTSPMICQGGHPRHRSIRSRPSRLRRAVPAECLPPPTRARPEPRTRHVPRTVHETPLGPTGGGPVTGLPPRRSARARWVANPPPSIAASRWLLRPKTRKLVFATFDW